MRNKSNFHRCLLCRRTTEKINSNIKKKRYLNVIYDRRIKIRRINSLLARQKPFILCDTFAMAVFFPSIRDITGAKQSVTFTYHDYILSEKHSLDISSSSSHSFAIDPLKWRERRKICLRLMQIHFDVLQVNSYVNTIRIIQHHLSKIYTLASCI